MRNRLGLASLAFALTLAGSAFATPLEDAGAAYKRGDYATAMRLIRPLAEQGNTAAGYNLGTIYYNGEGTRRDYAEALKLYRMAAEHGAVESARRAGFMYANGQVVPSDEAEALRWSRLASDRGDAGGQNSLGGIYGDG